MEMSDGVKQMASLYAMRDEDLVMLESTHNLSLVPRFCNRSVLINLVVLTAGLSYSGNLN